MIDELDKSPEKYHIPDSVFHLANYVKEGHDDELKLISPNLKQILLDFISPLFEEKDMRAVKGVG